MKHKTNIKGKNVYYGEGEKLVIVASTPFAHYSQTSLSIYDTLSFVTSLNKRCPCMLSDFTGFRVKSLVVMNGD
jgi:hypothetical protein